MTLKVLVAEDEPAAIDLLVELINEDKRFKVTGIAREGLDVVKKIESNRYDLVFLDIMLPNITGIEVLQRLEKVPCVIFTTAFSEYAVEAFELGAIDYILKPIEKNRLQKALERVVDLIAKQNNKPINDLGIFVRTKATHLFMVYDKIIYISSDRKISRLHLEGKTIDTMHLLGDMEEKLPKEIFVRIHKQFIVNINYISHVEYFIHGRYSAHLKDSEESVLPVGRKYKDLLFPD
ncbi:MAG: LytTR family DNA-binding domain-containing protein [Spirochaetota bacterium]